MRAGKSSLNPFHKKKAIDPVITAPATVVPTIRR
jgi:hypothetical protein